MASFVIIVAQVGGREPTRICYTVLTEGEKSKPPSSPSNPGRFILLARLLLQKAQRGPGVERPTILRDVVALATDVRDRRRLWGGASYEALEVASDAFLTLREVSSARQLVMPPPDGVATAAEAAAPSSLALVASTSLATGDPGPASLAVFHDDFYRHMNAAELASYEGKARSVVLGHLNEAMAAAGADSAKQLMVARTLALIGEWPIVGIDDIVGITPAVADYLEGVAALVTGHPSRTIELMRPHRNAEEEHAALLAEAYAAQGQIDTAVDELTRGAEHFNSPQLLVAASKMLYRNGRRVQATDVARSSLGLLQYDTRDRREMRSLLIDAAGARGDMADIIAHARAYLADDPEQPRVRWALVSALSNELRLEEAWNETRFGELEPDNEGDALVWLALESCFGHLAGRIDRLLRVVTDYGSSLELCAMFLTVSRHVAHNEIDEKARAQLSESNRCDQRTLPRQPLLQVRGCPGP